MAYPNDDTGRLLAEMADAGLDMEQVYDVDFFFVFEKREFADAMNKQLQGDGAIKTVRVEPDEAPGCWDVVATLSMKLEHEALLACERRLEAIAEKHRGYGDGWGVLADVDA